MDSSRDGDGVESTHYRCAGCGRRDTIVSVDLVPRIIAVRPRVDGPDYVPESLDTAYWEASVTIGFACRMDDCRYWQANYGVTWDASASGGTWTIVAAPAIDEVARVT